MNYLEFFHFDNYPFTVDNNVNYFYPKKSFLRIIDEIVKFCRFKSGIFTITGNSGVGKTLVLNKILETLNNNDFTIFINADEKTEVLKIIAKKLGMDCKNISDILIKLSNVYSNGKNVIIAIDNAENLSKNEFVSLNSLKQVLPNLKIILCGNKHLYRKLNQNVIKPIKKHIVQKFKMKHFSFFTTISYISYIEKNALALSQYKRVFSLPAILLIALTSNRNTKHINLISERSLINAFNRNKTKVYLKDTLMALKENFDYIKYDIYHKFQKLFLYILLILSAYYSVKIVMDRNDLIKHIEAQESIRQQEKELRDL